MFECAERFRWLVSGLALLVAGCAKPYPTPAASIVALGADGKRVACAPLTAPVAGRIGAPVPVTAACSDAKGWGSLTYYWSLVDAPMGSTALLGNADAVTPTFIPDIDGTFRLRLAVSNGVVTSEPVFATLAVGPCGGRAPRVSVTSSASLPHVGQLVTLSAAIVDDDTLAGCAAHAADFDLAWSLVAVPAGSHAALNSASVVAPSFVVDVPGAYVARVVATDPTGRMSNAGDVQIEAAECGGHAPLIGAITPSSSEPHTGEVVTVSAAVTDADTDASCRAHAATFEYTWAFTELPPGSVATLNDEHVAAPSFVPDVSGTYTLDLVVTDPTGREAIGTFSVAAKASETGPAAECGLLAPVARAKKQAPGAVVDCDGSAIPVRLGADNAVELDAGPSFDPDDATCGAGQFLDYRWTLLATPLHGGASRLESQDGRTTILRVASPGAYAVKLVVTDSTGLVSRAAVCALHVFDRE